MIDDGVYLDLPMSDYLADRALSGGAFKKLLSAPADLTWERPENPLWEERATRPRTRGSAAHCAILEGLDAYEARWCVEPNRDDYPDALETMDELREWLRPHKERDPKGVKLTGAKDDLIAQCRAIAAEHGLTFGLWSEIRAALTDGRELVTAEDDQYVRLLERFVRADPTFAPLVRDGLPEVSIFWSEDGLRFKARIDYLTAHTVLDLKTYGQPPRRNRSLREQCVVDAAFNGYDLQAAHNTRAVEIAAQMCVHETLALTGRRRDDIERCAEILRECHAGQPVFRWLFLRMGGAPTGISIPFRESDPQWAEARRQIDDACETYKQLRERFAENELWLVTYGEEEIQNTDWPLAAIRSAA